MTTLNTTTLPPKPIMELQPNGDPYGSGFTGRQSDDDGKTWYYRVISGLNPEAGGDGIAAHKPTPCGNTVLNPESNQWTPDKLCATF